MSGLAKKHFSEYMYICSGVVIPPEFYFDVKRIEEEKPTHNDKVRGTCVKSHTILIIIVRKQTI